MTNYIPLLNRMLSNKVIRYIYALHKERSIIKSLKSEFDPNNVQEPFGLLLDERIVEYPWLISKIKGLNGRLLDAGSILNFNYLLKHSALREKQIFISTLAPEKHAYWQNGVSYIFEDMRDVCYKDNYFDIITCLSVIEHVGMDNTKHYTTDPLKKEQTPSSYINFIAEMKRIIKPKGYLFLSIPFGQHRNYGWLQTFDGAMVDSIVETFNPSAYFESYFRYREDGWQACSRVEASDCQYFDFYDKSYTHNNDRAIAAEGVVLLELRK